MKASLNELVEERLAAELGWNLRLLHGETFQLSEVNLKVRAEYTIVNPSAFFLPRKSRLSHLRLTRWLKFGNSVEQLHHLFLLAKTYDIRQVVLPPSKIFHPRKVGEIELIAEEDGTSGDLGVGIAGLFYRLEPFCLEGPENGLLPTVQRYVRPLLSETLREVDPRVGENDLVLHFRAGDIFTHPVADYAQHYGQPPLAFYLAAIEKERPQRTWLVFENRANPCIDAAEAWLKARRLEVVTQSSSLEEDLRVLMSARRLVIGAGTFGISVAILSTQLRRIYTFKSETWDYFRLPGVEMVQGVDVAGSYTTALLSHNWTASDEQRALMLSYPAETIRFNDGGETLT